MNFVANDGVGVGGYYPLDRFVQAGTNLWFTTERGGTYDAGTISRFDLVTREIVQVASLDESATNNVGSNPDGGLLVVGDAAYFTTKNGGAGDNGTIAKINLTDGLITVLHDFDASGEITGETPRGGLTLIGDSLFCTTSSGGSNDMGTILRFSLTSNAVSWVHHFDGANTGRQPYEGFTKAGDAYYFTTFAGGTNNGSGFGNGAGVLGRMTFDEADNPVITKVLNLNTGYTAFPAQNPVLVGTNSLYFTTVGNNPAPGALVRYDIDTGLATNVFYFSNNATAQALYGKQPGYNGLTEWLGELYFMSRQGGTNNQGVIAKFNIASNTVTKLVDLGGTGETSVGYPSLSYNSGLIVEETNRFFIYYPVSRGGANTQVTSGCGTIVRVALPAPPIQSAIKSTGVGEVTLTWTGGYLPFSVQSCSDLTTGVWNNVVEGATNRSVTLSNLTDRAFFRVAGQP
ncbi:MAG TPA: choice-of-anchor tandem repeat GloVer-containing protein [Verrucomicrobiae bacterium]|nr:choice-of-anchor tandem repeat GloVer-containing protein [Verrucomicrobiae bacterium]